MNLVVQDLLSDLHLKCVDKIRAVADHVLSSPQRRQEWERIYLTERKTNKFIELNVKTRWNSTFHMIKDAIECEQVVRKYTKGDSDALNEPLTGHDWKLLKELLGVLDIFD